MSGDRCDFSVQDDGTGFDKRMVRGLGLLGMEERVRRLGGSLRIDSQPGAAPPSPPNCRCPKAESGRDRQKIPMPHSHTAG